jgi:HAD superfamily hydrolase (TIGR01509 family)
MMPTFHAAIFDLDGLLIDTERLAIAAGHEIIALLGLPAAPGLFESLVGKDDATGARHVAAHFGPSFPLADFGQRWNRRFAEKLDDGIPLRPGAIDLLDAIEALGLPRAVATSSRRASAHRKLALTGLAPRFATVVTFDCIANPKPAPDPYLEAAARLGFDPARCIAFEDSDTGVAAARAAGMTVVQVPDMQPSDGRHASHFAADLMSGARMAGLI